MQGLAVVLFPVLLMLFALAMERVEFRLGRQAVPENEVAEFLEEASSTEVAALSTAGLPDALARFHRRRRGREDTTASTPAVAAQSAS